VLFWASVLCQGGGFKRDGFCVIEEGKRVLGTRVGGDSMEGETGDFVTLKK